MLSCICSNPTPKKNKKNKKIKAGGTIQTVSCQVLSPGVAGGLQRSPAGGGGVRRRGPPEERGGVQPREQHVEVGAPEPPDRALNRPLPWG